jgi:regulator of nonsense transcripts 1
LQGSEEVALEIKEGRGAQPPPLDVTTGWAVEFVWKGTTFERMQRAMRVLAVEETSVSGYLYHRCAVRVQD